MNKAARIQKIVELTERQRKRAIRNLGEKIANREYEQEKKQKLMEYRNECSSQFSCAPAVNISVDQLIQHRLFREKLNDAIAQQEAVISQCDREIDMAKSVFLEYEKKLMSYTNLKCKIGVRDRRIADKREQGEIDDRVRTPRE